MPKKLPKGWVKTTLGDLVEPSRERASPLEYPDTRYVGLEHIEPHSMKLVDHGYARDVRSSSVRFSKGDVLYGKMRPYLNKVWLAEFDGLCSAEFLVFKQHDGLNSQFLATRLNSDDFVSFANGQVSGERPRVDFEKLSLFRIHLPPLAEQERIVVKLTAAFSRVDRAETAARRARERLARYRGAVLASAVSGELTRAWRVTEVARDTGEILLQRLLVARRGRWEEAELRRFDAAAKTPKDDKWKLRYREPTLPKTEGLPEEPTRWAWISIDQLSWNSSYGTSVKCTYEGKGPAVLRIPNIRNRTVDFSDLKFATSSNHFKDENFVAPGDLLLIRTNGSKDLIGRIAIVKQNPPRKCSFASYLIRFRLVGEGTIWSWISLAWDSNMLRSGIESRAATTAGQYNVSLSGLADLAVPLPPIDEQTEIVREVERRMSAANRLEASLEQQLIRARATRQSLLHEAFSGRLVPQDSKDEPASVLLKNIRAARQEQAENLRGTRMPKPKRKSKVVIHRPVLEVLREHQKPMTPEQLFRDSGYQQEFEDNECRQEIVDKFYEELQQIVSPQGPVVEKRPDRKTVLLQVKP
jgi:type I restriction enzyme S subunit